MDDKGGSSPWVFASTCGQLSLINKREKPWGSEETKYFKA
jgi:hypothetical protein